MAKRRGGLRYPIGWGVSRLDSDETSPLYENHSFRCGLTSSGANPPTECGPRGALSTWPSGPGRAQFGLTRPTVDPGEPGVSLTQDAPELIRLRAASPYERSMVSLGQILQLLAEIKE